MRSLPNVRLFRLHFDLGVTAVKHATIFLIGVRCPTVYIGSAGGFDTLGLKETKALLDTLEREVEKASR